MLDVNDRVAVIDDDEDGRDTIIDQLREYDYEGLAISGQYGNDIHRLLQEIEAAKPDFVICDHRLTAQQFALFNGLQVVEQLIAYRRPAMLLTTFQDPDRMVLRAARARVPVIKGRDKFKFTELSMLHNIVQQEIDKNPVASRKPHRVLLRVEDVRGDEIDVIVPSWNRDHALVLTKGLICISIRDAIRNGNYLLGNVNIGAPSEDELFFDNINEIVKPIEGLL